jgi:hypothetical protein
MRLSSADQTHIGAVLGKILLDARAGAFILATLALVIVMDRLTGLTNT